MCLPIIGANNDLVKRHGFIASDFKEEIIMENWKKMIEEEAGDDKIIAYTLTEEELLKEFDTGFGGTNGKEFTAWGEKYVYFPICYDGAEWVGKAPRNPCEEVTDHMGGG